MVGHGEIVHARIDRERHELAVLDAKGASIEGARIQRITMRGERHDVARKLDPLEHLRRHRLGGNRGTMRLLRAQDWQRKALRPLQPLRGRPVGLQPGERTSDAHRGELLHGTTSTAISRCELFPAKSWATSSIG